MNEKINTIKEHIIKNKEAKISSKILSSNFKGTSTINNRNDNLISFSSLNGYNENEMNTTLSSSHKIFSKFRLSKLETSPLPLHLNNFHKEVILKKNHLNFFKNKNSLTIESNNSSKIKNKIPSILSCTISTHSNPILKNRYNEYKEQAQSPIMTTAHSSILKLNKNLNNSNENISKKNSKKIKFDISSDFSKINEGNDAKYFIRKKNSLYDLLTMPKISNYFSEQTDFYNNPQLFVYKIKSNAYERYLKKINENNLILLNSYVDGEIIKNGVMKEYKLKLIKNLNNIYSETLFQYITYLKKTLIKLKNENEELKLIKTNNRNCVEKLKNNIKIAYNKIKEGFHIKYFLMCLKNQALTYDKFTFDDYRETKEDIEKMNKLYNYLFIDEHDKDKEIIFHRKNYVRNTLDSRNLSSNKKEEKNLKNSKRNIRYKTYRIRDSFLQLPKGLTESIDEFLTNFDIISSKLNNLIVEYNKKITQKTSLQIELSNIERTINEKNKTNNILKLAIQENEIKLSILKEKNKKNLLFYNQLINDNKIKAEKMNIVEEKIFKIYNELKEEFPSSTDEIKDCRFCLKTIENIFIKYLNYNLRASEKHQEDYKILRTQLEKTKKREAFQSFQNLLIYKNKMKLAKIEEKSSKIIFRNFRIGKDFVKYHSQSKKVINKNNIGKEDNFDLLFKYLNND